MLQCKVLQGFTFTNFDIEKFNQKIDEFLSKVETQFLD